MTTKPDTKILLLARPVWVALAKRQLRRRLKVFGSKAKTCKGCLEILMCHGPVSFEVCHALDEGIASGILSGPKKIPFGRVRRKYLPVSVECLAAYHWKIVGDKIRFRHK